jgi:hypothetical protein
MRERGIREGWYGRFRRYTQEQKTKWRWERKGVPAQPPAIYDICGRYG